jgi:hypothetical protein
MKISWDSRISEVIGYGLTTGLRFPLGMEIYLTTTSVGLTQHRIQWLADPSPPSSAEVKNACGYTSTPQYTFTAWCSVKKSTGTTLLTYSMVQDII